MKKYLFLFGLFHSVLTSNAKGLEKIIVEKYYISDSNDAKAFGSHLPAGSVTYRMYVDMLPGYKFQAAYGVPGHELYLATTTLFFNNEDKGAVIPNVIPDRNLKDNTVMLDSWLSVGGASESNLGILKSEDTGIETTINADHLLQNADPKAGIPVKTRDGFIAGKVEQVTSFGIDSAIHVFNNRTIGNLFSTRNGSWACMNGSVGPTTENRVLIAQLTTDGILSFELNIQIGTPDHQVENYVAKNPTGNEIQLAGLIYSSSQTDPDKSRINKIDAINKK